MAEWFKAFAWKADVWVTLHLGFESLSLRQNCVLDEKSLANYSRREFDLSFLKVCFDRLLTVNDFGSLPVKMGFATFWRLRLACPLEKTWQFCLPTWIILLHLECVVAFTDATRQIVLV